MRGHQWNEEETMALLELISEMEMQPVFRGRMTMDFISKLTQPMEDAGFSRTAGQIKVKLRGLRQHYYKCSREGSNSKIAQECPYFETIHKFFTGESEMITVPRKKDVLMQIEVDENDQERFSNGFTKSVSRYEKNKAKKLVAGDHSQVPWEPFESIVGE